MGAEIEVIIGGRAVRIVADAGALAHAAADLFATVTTAAVAERGRAAVALSGGSTPRRMGELLAAPPYQERVPWGDLDIFWGDERWVAATSPESNAGEAKRTFLDAVPVSPERVFPFPTGVAAPEESAAAYEATLRRVVAMDDGLPRFDLILLGMGDDGHTASLFPKTAALEERGRLAVANLVPQLATTRLTLTVPVLNAGREVVFLVAGSGKAETVAAVLEGPDRPTALPSQLIRPEPGRLTWMIDQAAAAALHGTGDDGG